MSSNIIADGVVVSLAYQLEVDGEIVAQTEPGDPMEYLHGAENIVPGLEQALNGKRPGDKLSVTLPPDLAYGEYDPDDIDEVPLEDVGDIDASDLEVGMVLEVEDDEGDVYLAFVREIGEETLILDFNPPLAGKTLTYHVEVLGLRPATETELEHGHVHGSDWDEEDDDGE
ncbi:MAG: peptidylprolyl isomerase [Anaerolineae bacterium]|nr:peptidylprolyl isomerase [Anaerolineae bacterium]